MIKILLEAPILTQSGYGEHARLVYRALKLNTDIDLYVNPLDWGATSWASSMEEHLRESINKDIESLGKYINESQALNQPPKFDVQIHVCIPNEFEKKAQYSICVTAGIETDRVSVEWLIKTHSGIDKLIVPSEHARTGFESTSYEAFNEKTKEKTMIDCASKIEVVPYPVKEVQTKNLGFKSDTEFNFLCVSLLGPRKNMENMIYWVMKEFKNENVGLIVKTGRVKGTPMDLESTIEHLKKVTSSEKDRKCKVYLLHGDLEESEIHSLYLREDVHAYVSCTHGEGYGLPIFEAAYSGMPIVATDWSAHIEFLQAPYKEGGKTKNKKLFAKVDYDLSEIPQHAVWEKILIKGSKWAYPKEQSFRKQIRNMYKNHGMYKKWAKTLKSHIIETHENEKIVKQMSESIFSDINMSNAQNTEEDFLIL